MATPPKGFFAALFERERDLLIEAVENKIASHQRALNKSGLHPAVAAGLGAAVTELEAVKAKLKATPIEVAAAQS